MTQSIGRAACAVAAAVATALALAPGGAAQAADSCPNAAVRAQQQSTRLPDCRAYELASPVDKQGQMVRQSLPFVRPDGDAAMFRANGAMAGAQGNIGGDFVVRRTAAGWVTTPYVPALAGGLRIATLSDSTTVEALDADFEAALVSTGYPFEPDDQGRHPSTLEYTGEDLFRWQPGQSPFWLTRPVGTPDLSAGDTTFVWASEDLRRVVVRSPRPLTPELPSPPGDQLYLYADGRPADLLSVDDTGAPITLSLPGLPAQIAVSADGDTVALRDASYRLWLRMDAADPAAARTTAPAWGAERTVCTLSEGVYGFTADGSELLFHCANPLRAGDPAGTVYRGNVRTGAVTAVGPGLTAFGVSADMHALVGFDTSDPLHGTIVYADDDGVREIADVGVANPELDQVVFSANGRQVAFSTQTSLDPASGGFEQVYRFDADTGELDCVSCPGDGTPATGLSSIQAKTYVADNRFAIRRGAISADGRRVFFTSANALVPNDVNRQPDAYEWQDGEAHLLGSGSDRVGTAFAYASADGDTAFIYSTENLVPQDVDNGVNDLYAVRVDGGFLAPEQAAPCTSGCQGPLPVLEPLQTPGTVSFTGPDDVDDAAQPPVVKVFSVAGLSARTRAAWARGARAPVSVRLSHGGTATALMRARIGTRFVTVARASRRASGGGTVALPLRLSARARGVLRRRGALRIRVRVTVPGAGAAQSASFVLRTAKAKRGRR